MTSPESQSCSCRRAVPVDWAPTECTVRRLRINPCEICFVKYIFEGYDGLAVLSTVDAVLGIVSLFVAPGRESEADQVLISLAGQIRIEEAPGQAGPEPSKRQ